MPGATPYPGKKRTGGRQTVNYVDEKGRTRDAVVTGGTGDSLNLRIAGGGGASVVLTGVAKRTAINQTNVWYVGR